MDIQEKDDGLKIKIPIITNQKLEELDNNILNNYQTIYDKISKVVAKDRDIIFLKRIIEYQHNELDKKDKIINEYEKECKKTRAFARRIRKDEKRDIDQFNQGKEFASIQFLNLLANEPHWDYEGKYFDEVDREIGRYLKKAEGN